MFDGLSDFFGLNSNSAAKHKEDEANEQMLRNTAMVANIAYADEHRQAIQTIRQKNPDFNMSEFLMYVGKFFADFLNTRMTLNLDSIKQCMTKDLYDHMCIVYSKLKKDALTNMINGYTHESTLLVSYKTLADDEFIELRMNVSYMSYYLVTGTNKFVRGNRYVPEKRVERLTFMKNKNYSKEKEQLPVNCPNCGAPLDEAYINVCPYCNTVVPLPEKEWLLCSFKEVKQPL